MNSVRSSKDVNFETILFFKGLRGDSARQELLHVSIWSGAAAGVAKFLAPEPYGLSLPLLDNRCSLAAVNSQRAGTLETALLRTRHRKQEKTPMNRLKIPILGIE